MNGRNFCLRGGEEHRQLKLSQLTRKTDPDRYIYTEHASKNRSGALRQMRVENKIVPVIANPEAGIRCHVAILDLYLSKIPASAVSKDVFYLQLVPKVPASHGFCSPQLGEIPFPQWSRIYALREGLMVTRLIIVCKQQAPHHCSLLVCPKR